MADIPVANAAEAPKKSGKRLIIVLIAAIVLLAGGGVGAYFAFGSHGGKKTAEVKKEPVLPPQYIALDPPFVVNFEADPAPGVGGELVYIVGEDDRRGGGEEQK